jgi:hypothetical protein
MEVHEKGFLVAALVGGVAITFITSHLLLANGAMERPMAIAGWHKPGVMTAGAGQILLLLAQQYRAAGVTSTALLDTTPKSNYWYSMPWLVAGLTTPRQLFKGAC